MAMGMKREAVQEERQRGSRGDKNGGDDEVESSSLGPGDMPTAGFLEAERILDKFEREHQFLFCSCLYKPVSCINCIRETIFEDLTECN